MTQTENLLKGKILEVFDLNSNFYGQSTLI
jgi:hypothetical protein